MEQKYDANEQTAGMKIILKTADPRMVPVPISSFDMNTPITDVNNSGAEVPIAMNVAPATSAGNFNSASKKHYIFIFESYKHNITITNDTK